MILSETKVTTNNEGFHKKLNEMFCKRAYDNLICIKILELD